MKIFKMARMTVESNEPSVLPSSRAIARDIVEADRNLTKVRFGCITINPGYKNGRRILLIKMMVLSLIPIFALLYQNGSILLDSTNYYNSMNEIEEQVSFN